MNKVLSIVLGGGKGTRLFPLTKDRAKPAVPFGGKYRIVDIPISNCINSNRNELFDIALFLGTEKRGKDVRAHALYNTQQGGGGSS